MPKRKAVDNGNGPSNKKKKEESDDESLLSLSTVSEDVNPVGMPTQFPKRIVLGPPLSPEFEFEIPNLLEDNRGAPQYPQMRALLPHLNRLVRHINANKTKYPGGLTSSLRTPNNARWGNRLRQNPFFHRHTNSLQTEVASDIHYEDMIANLYSDLHSGLRYQGKTMMLSRGAKNFRSKNRNVDPDFEAAVHELRRFDDVMYNPVVIHRMERNRSFPDRVIYREINEKIGRL